MRIARSIGGTSGPEPREANTSEPAALLLPDSAPPPEEPELQPLLMAPPRKLASNPTPPAFIQRPLKLSRA